MPQITVDFIDIQKELLYLNGTALDSLQVGDSLSQVSEGKGQKQTSLARVDATIHAIIQDGEPIESIHANQTALIALSGDWQAIITAAESLRWKKKRSTYLRTTSQTLIVSDS